MGWNLGSAILPLLGSFVVSLLIAPHLGPERFGRYITVMAAATLALIVGKFGIHTATSRLLTEHEDQAGVWLRAGLRARTLFTLPVAVVVLGLSLPIAAAFDRGGNASPFWLTGVVVLAASYYEMAMESLVGLRRFGSLFVVRLAFLLLRLAAVAWVRLAALGTTAFVAGHALAQAIPAVVLLATLLRRYPAGNDAHLRQAAQRDTLRIALPLAISSASFLIYAQTDKLMLAWFRPASEVGQFGVARNILDAALFPVFALAWSLRPALVRAVHNRGGSTRETLAQGLRLSTVFALGAPALLFVFGPPLVRALFGETYAEAAALLIWMLPILFLRGLGTIIFPALLAADDQATYSRLMVATAAVNLVANLILIPPLGAEGAVLSTAVALTPLTVLGMAQVRRRLGALPWGTGWSTHLRSALASAALVAVGLWGPSPPTGLLPLLGWAGLATLLYVGVVLAGTNRLRSGQSPRSP